MAHMDAQGTAGIISGWAGSLCHLLSISIIGAGQVVCEQHLIWLQMQDRISHNHFRLLQHDFLL
jgi:hypothetical protein